MIPLGNRFMRIQKQVAHVRSLLVFLTQSNYFTCRIDVFRFLAVSEATRAYAEAVERLGVAGANCGGETREIGKSVYPIWAGERLTRAPEILRMHPYKRISWLDLIVLHLKIFCVNLNHSDLRKFAYAHTAMPVTLGGRVLWL